MRVIKAKMNKTVDCESGISASVDADVGIGVDVRYQYLYPCPG